MTATLRPVMSDIAPGPEGSEGARCDDVVVGADEDRGVGLHVSPCTEVESDATSKVEELYANV
jgi:hypothetical protein